MNRRKLLSRAAMIVASALVPLAGFAKNAVNLEQYERFRMTFHTDRTLDEPSTLVTGWVPVAFGDILEMDRIRKTRNPEQGSWVVVGCKRQDEGILEVFSVTDSRPITIDLLNCNLRVPRLR